jgi:hypothetical protein
MESISSSGVEFGDGEGPKKLKFTLGLRKTAKAMNLRGSGNQQADGLYSGRSGQMGNAISIQIVSITCSRLASRNALYKKWQ